MKKLLLLALLIAITISCVACSHGNVAKQEDYMNMFVTKYYGEYDIVSQKSVNLDTAQLYTLKDKTDGFQYEAVVMEVYLSDLGIQKEGESTAKTIMIDSYFYQSYLAHLANEVDKDEAIAFIEKYKSLGMRVIFPTFKSSLMDAFDSVYIETALMMNELNEGAIREFVALLREKDKRNLLQNCVLAIYVNENGNDEISTEPSMYYSFYFDTLHEAKSYDSFVALRDYLKFTNAQDVTVIKWENDVLPSKLPAKTNWIAVGDDVSNTTITYSIGEKQYMFHPALGYQESSAPMNEYGIHEGTFLDVVANEQTGCAELLIGMYGTMYPEAYRSLEFYNNPLQESEPDVSVSEDNPSQEVSE